MNAADLHVIKRFLLKVILLGSVALLRDREKALSTATMLYFIAAVLDACLAVIGDKRLRLRSLGHWDDAIGFVLLASLMNAISATLL